MQGKDAAVLKALEELGLRANPDPNSLSPEIQELAKQLDDYAAHIGVLDAKPFHNTSSNC